MVRERKHQTGASNLSARDAPLASVSSSAGVPDSPGGGILYANKSSFVRTWSHQLIAPEMYQPRDTGPKIDRRMKETATWKPSKVTGQEFSTTHKATYLDPRTISADDHGPREVSSDDIAAKATEDRARVRAVDTMCKVVKNTHGTVASLLRSFNKKTTDDISSSELQAYLHRHKLDEYVTDSDIQQVFAFVQPGRNAVPVKEFLQKVEQVEFNRTEVNQEQQHLKDFLELKLRQRRLQTQQAASEQKDAGSGTAAAIEALKKQKAVRNEAEMIRKALGMKTYNVDVDHEEFNEMIDTAFTHELSNDTQRKYQRFLHHSNLKLASIPFYDMRATELDRLKHRAATIHHTLEDPERIEAFAKLSETHHRGSLATSHSTDFLSTFKSVDRYKGISGWDDLPADGTSSHGPLEGSQRQSRSRNGGLAVSQSMSALNIASARPSPLSAPASGMANALSASSSSAVLPAVDPSSGRAGSSIKRVVETSQATPAPVSTRNLVTEGARGAEFSSMASLSPGPSARPSASVGGMEAQERMYAANEYEVHPNDFLPTIIDGSQSMGRMRDASKVLRLEKVDPVAETKHGRRLCEDNINRTSHMSNDNYDNGQATMHGSSVLRRIAHQLPPGALKEEDHYLTMNNKLYGPLLYQPSQPATRDAVSDAEINFRTKEYRRQQRYERLKANMDVTKTRLDYEAQQQELRSLHRSHSRVEDNIRYKTAILLQDLRTFRTQPLQRMARRQNIELADRMWRGNAEPLTVGIAKEERDFTSTYNSSFDSSVLSQSMNINSLEGLKPPGSVH